MSDWHGGLWQRASLGKEAWRVWAYGKSDGCLSGLFVGLQVMKLPFDLVIQPCAWKNGNVPHIAIANDLSGAFCWVSRMASFFTTSGS
jgi:hypothetical protein